MRWSFLAWWLLEVFAVIVSAENWHLDLSLYSQLLSTHLARDVDTAFYTMSKQISTQFRDALEVLGEEQLEPVSPVDVQILKRQLRGAVGSYIEDKLPTAWNRHDPYTLSLASLAAFIEKTVLELCMMENNNKYGNTDDDGNQHDTINTTTVIDHESNVISAQCLDEPRDRQLLSAIDRYINTHIQRTITAMAQHELPGLLDTTQHQVTDVLTHFKRMTGCQLELEINRNQAIAVHTVVEAWEQPTNEALLYAIHQYAQSARVAH
ncbi:predicted protein [Lichtheimia corymbifera JMRC:FSU:9682]|uniref:Uncharacterized protein n=1 Tax=Lichtheimia corymbifera JMRC:FSU:9682 TaxID=1263082 RepID=A0A068S5X5_9FUNG|nr:predicted protein [Lichtheimia corymbifera JMRC:FSU:9682]